MKDRVVRVMFSRRHDEIVQQNAFNFPVEFDAEKAQEVAMGHWDMFISVKDDGDYSVIPFQKVNWKEVW